MKFNIKNIREKKELTQEQLVERSGVSRATISKLESNETSVCNSQTLTKLADALGVPVSSLFVD